MGVRRKAREIAMQVLYNMDVCNISIEDAWNAFFEKSNGVTDKEIRTFARELVEGANKHKDEIDGLIKSKSKNWDMSRMASVDRAILRIGAFELLYCPSTPLSVIINEAVEIAKDYSTDDSGKFVNGVLDNLQDKKLKI